jgi:hypothetical protein
MKLFFDNFDKKMIHFANWIRRNLAAGFANTSGLSNRK